MARDIRRKALEKIASLSAGKVTPLLDNTDFDRLCKACPSHGKIKDGINGTGSKQPPALGRVPMTIREFEVLLALCKAAPAVGTPQGAQRLARQLIPYIMDSHIQVFAPSPFFRKIEPSPTEALSFHVVAALLSLGIKHDDVHDNVSDNIWNFINICARATEEISVNKGDEEEDRNLQDSIRTATIAVAMLGFLDAAAAQAHFWRSGGRLALITRLRNLLSEPFMTAVETSFSTIRNASSADRTVKEWKRYLRHYADIGRPLGAMLLQLSFMHLLVATTSLLVAEIDALKGANVLDLLLSGDGLLRPMTARSGDADFRSVETYANAVVDQMNYLEASADFVRMGSSSAQKLSSAVRASALISFLNCSRLNEDAADADLLMTWLDDTLSDPTHMADEYLASVVLKSMALICRISPSFASSVSRSLPRFIVQSGANEATVDIASKCLTFVLQLLSTDAIITTLYTLGNVLSPGNERALANGGPHDFLLEGSTPVYQGRQSTGSSISLPMNGEEENCVVYGNVVQAICSIARECKDEKIAGLAQSMLLQKINKIDHATDMRIIPAAAILALNTSQLEFRSLLKSLGKLCSFAIGQGRDNILLAVMRARNYLSTNIKRDSPLYDLYWKHMLDDIISKGDVHETHHAKESDLELAAREIAQLLQPLALFMSTNDLAMDPYDDDEMHARIRDAWFNIVVHGFTPATERGKKYLNELRLIAIHSPPLVAEQRGEQIESDIELNTILRRGMSSERENLQKKYLAAFVPQKGNEIRNLSYRKVIFLQSAFLVESLRADAGDCTKALAYFLEPSMRRGDVSTVMEGIAATVVERYLSKTVVGTDLSFSSQYAATQLASIFCACCHRIERVQQAAYACADRIIREVPSALCHKSSLFALLELLSLMWSSCLEAETDTYEPRSTFKSVRGKVTVELSDDYALRKTTLNSLYKRAKIWVSGAVNLAPADVKGLLQTYLSEWDDDGAYGHVSLGRSFAFEMGSSVPSTDQRLSSLDRLGETNINTASDFIAQYTTRQEYRYTEPLPDHSLEWLSFMRLDRRSSFLPNADRESTDAVTALAHIEKRLLDKKVTPIGDVRDILRRAASLLCRSDGDECAIAHYMVSIPFTMFSKQSMKLGISLWLGVMNENPRMEPRVLNEIAHHWEVSIQKRLGLFSTAIASPDPFFLKEEFAPSDAVMLAKKRQLVHNMLAPHTRLLQFFQSHFNATRLGSIDTQRVFVRLLDVTLDAFKSATQHPMARELRFQFVLWGLRVLRDSTSLGPVAQCRLKDKLLSAGLNWFVAPPKWSFGSNILQLRTEMRLLNDVMAVIRAVSHIGTQQSAMAKSMASREQLLLLLLENELTRLMVWVHPLNEPSKQHHVLHRGKGALEGAIIPLIRTAWNENPSLAVELHTRFRHPGIQREVRWLLLNFPAKAIDDPVALMLLLGGALPEDVTWQLKYLLYWAPVNPITAITFFLPDYQDNSFLIQYAMRALESHAVEVTFFYVPQIVQTLRYDDLGYIERYILETSQFSQLFAHQIIWNMKANMYKDDDGEIPAEIKPALDRVMTRMVDSFSPIDRQFYEREFSFFDEVTSISGKLKPLIGRPKPERAQKIEEELRKIKVEVGVYLPSNPEGIVIGIDRKSGKPLQSHAKAPYLATFRIQKTKAPVIETEEILEESMSRKTTHASTAGAVSAASAAKQQQQVVEVWQSAIFKVGDDCRQDVLALQMIACFRGIFHSIGLDAWVFPYRVTATAPGCGVIDVLPNSISRDMLGREAVNKLYDYFISKYGSEDSLRFQEARSNFVKSTAAYSIISYLLQFKDRHNGNIMIDDAGHIIHIDFGFCFDIAPGGIKFERAPFKLTKEMMAVMCGGGDDTDAQAFRWFEELCVKAFLASRPHCEKLTQVVLLMAESGLPCFKPETLRHFRERFVLEKSEREAAEHVRELVKRSASSYSTGVYDQFQLITNGIPY